MTETDARLKEIREREEKATKGMWEANRFLKPNGDKIETPDDMIETLTKSIAESEGIELFGVTITDRVVCYTGNGPTSDANCIFIAHSRSDIPYLLSLIDTRDAEIADYKEVHVDHKRLVRELDVLLNGKDGAAQQASLCDLVAQFSRLPNLIDLIRENATLKAEVERLVRENYELKSANSDLGFTLAQLPAHNWMERAKTAEADLTQLRGKMEELNQELRRKCGCEFDPSEYTEDALEKECAYHGDMRRRLNER